MGVLEDVIQFMALVIGLIGLLSYIARMKAENTISATHMLIVATSLSVFIYITWLM